MFVDGARFSHIQCRQCDEPKCFCSMVDGNYYKLTAAAVFSLSAEKKK